MPPVNYLRKMVGLVPEERNKVFAVEERRSEFKTGGADPPCVASSPRTGYFAERVKRWLAKPKQFHVVKLPRAAAP